MGNFNHARAIFFIAILLISLLGQVGVARAGTVSVPCSASALIAAIETANAAGGADVLNLAVGCTYILTIVNNETLGANGLPVIEDATAGTLTINGNGATITRGYRVMLPMISRTAAGAPGSIDNGSPVAPAPPAADSTNWSARSASAEGLPDFRIFMVASGGSLTLNNVTVQNGFLPMQDGGGIYNAGTLAINSATLSGNTATQGGGIFNTGTLTVTESTFANNTASAAGGGINSSGALTVTASAFTGNTANLSDAILDTEGTSVVDDETTFSGSPPVSCPHFPVTVGASDEVGLVVAIHCANSKPNDNVINLTNSIYTLALINSVGYENDLNGLPRIADEATTGTLTINGNGAVIERSKAYGTPDFRIFMLTGGDLTLNNVTLRNGSVPWHNGGAVFVPWGTLAINNSTITTNTGRLGGGVYINWGSLTVDNSTFHLNASEFGGGIGFQTGATVTVTNSTFTDQTSIRDGGAINGAGTLIVSNSTFSNNIGNGLCGGILIGEGTAVINNSTFAGNKSITGMAGGAGLLVIGATVSVTNSTFTNNDSLGAGGAIFNGGTLTVTNSTFTGNNGYGGGGIWNNGTVTITHSTISGNSVDVEGGGIYNGGNGTVYLGHTIVAGNTTSNKGPDIYTYIDQDLESHIESQGYNIIGDTTGASITGNTTGNLINAAAAPLNLGTLLNNGGPTQTRALGDGSVAINAGNPAFAAPPAYDQRGAGFPRVVGGRVDIGAYER